MMWNPQVVAGIGAVTDPTKLHKDMHTYLAGMCQTPLNSCQVLNAGQLCVTLSALAASQFLYSNYLLLSKSALSSRELCLDGC